MADALHVIADDLTGACDVAAALLPWPTGITVYPDGMVRDDPGSPGRPLAVRNTQSRTLQPAAAARRVRGALASIGRAFEGVLLKKIDTGLRGPLGAEIDAALDALGAAQAFILPAIPEVGRTTVGGEQLVGGVPVHRTAFADDPHNPVRDARVGAVIEATGRRSTGGVALHTTRRPEQLGAALDGCRAPVVVIDAETDEDLAIAVRVLLARPRPWSWSARSGPRARSARRYRSSAARAPASLRSTEVAQASWWWSGAFTRPPGHSASMPCGAVSSGPSWRSRRPAASTSDRMRHARFAPATPWRWWRRSR